MLQHFQAKSFKHKENRRAHPYQRKDFVSARNETESVKYASISIIHNLHGKQLQLPTVTNELAVECIINGNMFIICEYP